MVEKVKAWLKDFFATPKCGKCNERLFHGSCLGCAIEEAAKEDVETKNRDIEKLAELIADKVAKKLKNGN